MENIQFDFDKDVKYEKVVSKVRAIVINKQGRALLVKYAGLYMLPGGKIDEGENELQALKREILEESGIEINEDEAKEFLQITSYDKNYYDRKEKKDINRITNTKFYVVYTDQKIDDENKNLTESEKEKKQTIEFINLSIIPYLVETNKTDNRKKDNFDREILTVLKEFQKFKENEKETDERE